VLKATIKQTLKPALFGKSMWQEHYIPAKTYWEMARIRAIVLMSQHRLFDAAPYGQNNNPELKFVILMTYT
jgi:hypothetical protein